MITPILFGLYWLPGNQFWIQIKIKQLVKESQSQLYKFMYDYADSEDHKIYFYRGYIMKLFHQFQFLDGQSIETEGQFEQIIKNYIMGIHENKENTDFVLIQLDILLKYIIDRNYYHYFIQYNSLLIDVIDIINVNLKQSDNLEYKYQFEINRINPIIVLMCSLLQYSLNLKERSELYTYYMQIMNKNQLIPSQLQLQHKTLMPNIYKDLAIQNDQLNEKALQFINQWHNLVGNNQILTIIIKDELISNLIRVLPNKSNIFKQQFMQLLTQIASNQEIIYKFKQTTQFDQEKQRLLECIKSEKDTKIVEIHQSKIAGQQCQKGTYFVSQFESEEIGNANIGLCSYNKECGQKMEGYLTYPYSANFVVASPGVVGKLKISYDWLQKMQQVHNGLESYRKLLKEITFEDDVKSLPPQDRRNSIIYSILQELFKEIEFQQQNILICQHQISRIFIIYFSDIEMAPISKCCYKNIQIQIGQANGGRIVCPKLGCPVQILSTFEIKEELLWQKRYGTPYKDLGVKLSNYVQSGKYRTKSLANSIQDSQNASRTQKKGLIQQKTFYQQNTERSPDDNINIKKINNQDSFRFDLIRNILLNSKMFNTNTNTNTNKKISQIDDLLSYNIQ